MAGTVVVALLATVSGHASAAPDRAAASSNSRWLAGRLVDGAFDNPSGGGVDHGLMIDAVIAMVASGDAELAAPIVERLDDRGEARDFFTFHGFLGDAGADDRVGGATAKTLVAALVAGRDPRDFAGFDLVAETRAVITPDGAERGRVRDLGPNTFGNTTNTFGQAFAVIGLAGVGATDADVIAQLLRQQCAEGYFRIYYAADPDGRPNSCDGGRATDQSPADGDATGVGLSALLTARAAGAGGLDDAIDRAVAWLVAHQGPDGGWGGGVGTEARNTNSTGLVTQALAAAGGQPAAVDAGAVFVRSVQVGPAGAGHPLAGEAGAIAYDRSGFDAAQLGGIGAGDSWIRAGTQASLALSQVPFAVLVGLQPAPPTPTTTTGIVPTTATPPTTAAVSAGTAGRPEAPGRSGGAPASTLPATGDAVGPLLATAAGLVLTGAALVTIARRPTPPQEP